LNWVPSSLDMNFSFEGIVFFLFLLPFAFFFVHYTYKHTHPDTSSTWRWCLMGLRCVSTMLIIALLAEPALDVWNKKVQNPRLLVLLDTSPSMGVRDRESTRLEKVKAVFRQADWVDMLDRIDERIWGFSHDVYAIDTDTLENIQTHGRATNIGAAIERSAQEEGGINSFQAVLLISDGAHNLGLDPIKTIPQKNVPIYSLVVGNNETPVDLRIASARAVEVGYVGKKMTIEADLISEGYQEQSTEVILYEGNRELERRNIVLRAGLQRLLFATIPATPGPHVYRLFVKPLLGELTRDNNEALVFTRVMEERLRATIIASKPSSDLSFIRRSIAADSSLVLKTLIRKSPGQLYNGIWDYSTIEDSDVLVLLGYEDGMWTGEAGQYLLEKVRSGMGLIFIGGSEETSVWREDYVINKLLPVELTPSAFLEKEMTLRMSAEGENHPMVRLNINNREGGDPWKQLPPLPGVYEVIKKREGARVLLENQDGKPVIVSGTFGRGKKVVALSHSFWRLDLVNSGVMGSPQTIREFWRNTVRWLATSAPAGRVRASTERHIYRAGAPVIFTGQVFDELLRPQDGCSVRVLLANGEIIQLQDQGGGYYRGVQDRLAPGEYEFTVVAEYDGEQIGREEGRFIVETHSIEWSDLRANRTLLGDIARVSGGLSLDINESSSLLSQWSLKQKIIQEKREFRLWGDRWPLVLLVLFLALEWVLRKRLGMV
jgi:hypothetical protein